MKTSSVHFKWVYAARCDREWHPTAHVHAYHEMSLMLQGTMQVESFGFEPVPAESAAASPKNDAAQFRDADSIVRHAIAGMLLPRKTPTRPGATHVARAGDIVFYPRGLVHRDSSIGKEPIHNYGLHFLWPHCPKDMPLVLKAERGRVHVLIEWLIEETESWNSMTPVLCKKLLETIVSQLLRIWLCRDDQLLQTIRRYVRSHAAEPIALEALADEAGLSKYHFIRRFKQATGLTPMEEVRRLRVEYARELIMTSKSPLKEIAPRAGLCDEYHMSRLFKCYFGLTPGSLRRG